MNNQQHARESDQTFVTRLTADAPGAIAVLRLWGRNACEIADRFFQPRSGCRTLADSAENQLRLGWFGRDEVVAVRLHDHQTGMDEVEIQGHGSPILIRSILNQLASAEVVETDQATYQQAHGVGWLERLAARHLNRASAPKAIRILWNQSQGELRSTLNEIVAAIEARQIDAALTRLKILLETARWATRLSGGFSVALAGPPNVGKSTLINALAGFNRVVVSPVPGTTRDLVDVPLTIGGWPIVMTDMAGLRDETQDPLEAAGIALARSRQRRSDLVISLAEAIPGHGFQPRPDHENELRVWTKSDLTPGFQPDQAGDVVISAQSGAGLEKLMHLIIQKLIPQSVIENADESNAVVFDPDISELVSSAIAAMEQQDIGRAVRILGAC